MTESQTLTRPDGRQVGFADFGPADARPVLWCHGGPGSRLEPSADAAAARAAGYRFIGVDRPGYGLSTPQPGRTIGGWVPDGLAVLDALRIDRAVVVGVSTGGAYALALAAAAPERVTGVIACCALTDEVIDAFAVAGPVTYCVERLLELREMGLRRFYLTGPGRGADRDAAEASHRRVVEQILPAMR